MAKCGQEGMTGYCTVPGLYSSLCRFCMFGQAAYYWHCCCIKLKAADAAGGPAEGSALGAGHVALPNVNTSRLSL